MRRLARLPLPNSSVKAKESISSFMLPYIGILILCTTVPISSFSTNRCPTWQARREEPPAGPLRMLPTGPVGGDFSIWLHVEPPDPASWWNCSHRPLA
jgi:hypothetical protein